MGGGAAGGVFFSSASQATAFADQVKLANSPLFLFTILTVYYYNLLCTDMESVFGRNQQHSSIRQCST
jgi:hypothetical protein